MRTHTLSCFGIAAICLAGCASAPRPDAELAVAQSLVEQARSANANTYASVTFSQARQKLDRARLAAAEEEHARARVLAEQAAADAELALAQARTAQQQTAVAEIQQGIEVLQRQLNAQERQP